MAVDVKKVANAYLVSGKYPKKDGGVSTLASDAGEIIVLREGGKVTYQFPTLNKSVTLNIPAAAPAPKATTKAPVPASKVPDKKVAPLAPKAKKEEKIPKEAKEPIWVEQLAYDGQKEMVDFNIRPNIITCACGNIRYVANADAHQVIECKPCARKHRRQRRRVSVRERGATDKGATWFSKNIMKNSAKKSQPRKAAQEPVKSPVPKKK